MAIADAAHGTQTAVIGTEHTLATVTSPNTLQLLVDVANMTSASGTDDRLEIREYVKVLSGGTERLVKTYTITGAQSELVAYTPPRGETVSIKYTLKQTQGTGRNFDWRVQQFQ